MTTASTVNIEVIESKLQSMTIRQVQSIYPDYFKALESHVLSLADKAKNNESQWKLFALARSIKQQKLQLGQRMDRSLLDAFMKFRMGKLSKEPKASDLSTNLSLIQDEDLERSIAVSSFARRAEARYMEVLYTLNQRMAFLAGGKKLADDGNPLGPAQLAQSLTFMLDPLNLDSQLLSFASQLFEQQSVKPLKSLYDEANALLIASGLLPNLKYSITQRSGPASQQSAPNIPSEQSINSENAQNNGNLAHGTAPNSGSSLASPSSSQFGHSGGQAGQQVAHSVQQAAQMLASQVAQQNSSGGAEYQQSLLDNICQIQQQARGGRSSGIAQPSQAALEQAIQQGDANAPVRVSEQNSAAIPDVNAAFGQGAGHGMATVNCCKRLMVFSLLDRCYSSLILKLCQLLQRQSIREWAS